MEKCGPGSGVQRFKQLPDLTVAWSFVQHVIGSSEKEKQEWAIGKPKVDNARKLRGIYFIDPKDGEYKEISTNARKKLEIPMEALRGGTGKDDFENHLKGQ